jgi:hypothetical protein
MDIEIVLDQHDGLGTREVDVGQILQDLSIIDGGALVCRLDMAPAFKRREHHEQVGGAIALVFVIDAGRARPGFIGMDTRVSAMSCLEVSSTQTRGRSGSWGRVYTASTSSIAATKALLAFGGMTQHCRRCGLRMFF